MSAENPNNPGTPKSPVPTPPSALDFAANAYSAPGEVKTADEQRLLGLEGGDTNVTVTPINRQDWMHDAQGTGEAMANAATKTILNTGVNVLGGVTGFLYGLGASTSYENGFKFDGGKMFDNALLEKTDEMSKSLEETFKVYHSEAYDKDYNFFKKFTEGASMFDESGQAISFMAGGIITEYITAGLASVALANTLGKVNKVGKLMSAVENTADIARLASSTNKSTVYGAKLAISAGRIARQAATSTYYEATMEAYGFGKDMEATMAAKHFETYGEEPSESDMEKYRDEIASQKLNIFVANAVILQASNAITFPTLFKKGGLSKALEVGKASNMSYKDFYSALSGKALTTSSGSKLVRSAKWLGKTAKPLASEAMEEGSQYIITKAAETDTFASIMSDKKDPNSAYSFLSFLNTVITKSAGEALSDREFWNNAGMGALLGAAGFIGKNNPHRQAREESEIYAQSYNNIMDVGKSASFTKAIYNTISSYQNAHNIEEATANNDELGLDITYQKARDLALIKMVNAGGIENVDSFIDNLQTMSLTDYAKEAGEDVGTIGAEEKAANIKELKASVSRIKKAREATDVFMARITNNIDAGSKWFKEHDIDTTHLTMLESVLNETLLNSDMYKSMSEKYIKQVTDAYTEVAGSVDFDKLFETVGSLKGITIGKAADAGVIESDKPKTVEDLKKAADAIIRRTVQQDFDFRQVSALNEAISKDLDRDPAKALQTLEALRNIILLGHADAKMSEKFKQIIKAPQEQLLKIAEVTAKLYSDLDANSTALNKLNPIKNDEVNDKGEFINKTEVYSRGTGKVYKSTNARNKKVYTAERVSPETKQVETAQFNNYKDAVAFSSGADIQGDYKSSDMTVEKDGIKYRPVNYNRHANEYIFEAIGDVSFESKYITVKGEAPVAEEPITETSNHIPESIKSLSAIPSKPEAPKADNTTVVYAKDSVVLTIPNSSKGHPLAQKRFPIKAIIDQLYNPSGTFEDPKIATVLAPALKGIYLTPETATKEGTLHATNDMTAADMVAWKTRVLSALESIKESLVSFDEDGESFHYEDISKFVDALVVEPQKVVNVGSILVDALSRKVNGFALHDKIETTPLYLNYNRLAFNVNLAKDKYRIKYVAVNKLPVGDAEHLRNSLGFEKFTDNAIVMLVVDNYGSYVDSNGNNTTDVAKYCGGLMLETITPVTKKIAGVEYKQEIDRTNTAVDSIVTKHEALRKSILENDYVTAPITKIKSAAVAPTPDAPEATFDQKGINASNSKVYVVSARTSENTISSLEQISEGAQSFKAGDVYINVNGNVIPARPKNIDPQTALESSLVMFNLVNLYLKNKVDTAKTSTKAKAKFIPGKGFVRNKKKTNSKYSNVSIKKGDLLFEYKGTKTGLENFFNDAIATIDGVTYKVNDILQSTITIGSKDKEYNHLSITTLKDNINFIFHHVKDSDGKAKVVSVPHKDITGFLANSEVSKFDSVAELLHTMTQVKRNIVGPGNLVIATLNDTNTGFEITDYTNAKDEFYLENVDTPLTTLNPGVTGANRSPEEFRGASPIVDTNRAKVVTATPQAAEETATDDYTGSTGADLSALLSTIPDVSTEGAPKKAPKKELFFEGPTDAAPHTMKSLIAEIEHVQSILPNVPISIARGLVTGRYGMYHAGAITLYDTAVRGTAYHEAFHAVSVGMLSPTQRDRVYNLTREAYPLTEAELAKYNGNVDIATEEKLAEMFREFMLTGQFPYSTPIPVKGFFNKILRFIKDILGIGSTSEVNKLFSDIKAGKFAGNKVQTLDGTKYFSDGGIQLFSPADRSILLSSVPSMLNEYFYQNDKSFLEGLRNFSTEDFVKFVRTAAGYRAKTEEDESTKLLNAKLYSALENGTEDIEKDIVSYINSLQIDDLIDQDALEEDTNESDKTGIRNSIESSLSLAPSKTASAKIKLLLNTSVLTYTKNEFGIPSTMSFGKAFSLLVNQLSNSESLGDMNTKLASLAAKETGFYDLMGTLKINEFLSFPSSLTYEEIDLINNFYQAFGKANINYIAIIAPTEGNTVAHKTIDGGFENAKTMLYSKLSTGFNSSDYATTKGNKIVTTGEYVDKNVAGVANGRLVNFFTNIKYPIPGFLRPAKGDISYPAYLKGLGIMESDGIVSSEEVDKLVTEYNADMAVLDKAMSDLFEMSKTAGGNMFDIQEDESGRTASVANRVTQYAKIEELMLKWETNMSENFALGSDGKKLYTNVLHNYHTTTLSLLNSATSYQELVAKYPYFADPLIKDSYIVSKLFNSDGSKRIVSNLGISQPVTVDYNIISSISDGGKNNYDYENLDYASRLKITIENHARGIMHIVRPSDNSQERTLVINEGDAKVDDFNAKAQSYFTELLVSEAKRIVVYYANRDQYLPKNVLQNTFGTKDGSKVVLDNALPMFFREELQHSDNSKPLIKNEITGFKAAWTGLLNTLANYDGTNEEEMSTRITQFLGDANVNKIVADFIDSSVKSTVAELKSERVYDKIDATLGFDKIDTDSFVSRGVKGFMIGAVENLRVFNGSFVEFKNFADLIKRGTGLTGTKRPLIVDQQFNEWLNNNVQRMDGKVLDTINPTARMHVFQETSVRSESAAYIKQHAGVTDYEGGIAESDATSIVSMDFYRHLLLASSQWGKDLEIAYQREVAFVNGTIVDGRFTIPDNHFMPSIAGRTYTETEVDGKGAVFNILKPQYYGPEYYATGSALYGMRHNVFVKTAFVPAIPSAIRKLNMSNIEQMLRTNQVDIYAADSAVKQGIAVNNQGGLFSPFTEDGSVNQALDSDRYQELYLKFMGIQVDIAPKIKTETKTGTQQNIMNLGYLFSNGVPKKDEYVALVNEAVEADNERLTRAMDQLAVELGLGVSGDNYTVTTKTRAKIAKFLKDRAIKDRLEPNLVSTLEYIKDLGLDAVVGSDKIEQSLYKIVRNNAINLKRFGGNKIQASTIFFDDKDTKRAKVVEQGKEHMLNTKKLNFYYDANNKMVGLEVLLPNYIKEMFGTGTDEEILAKIKGSDKELLELLGFRIPTQGLSSIEFITIKGFLAPQYGDTIVLPAEITKKSGGDFDIDKLNIYLPNYHFIDGAPKFTRYITGTTREAAHERAIQIVAELEGSDGSTEFKRLNRLAKKYNETLTGKDFDLKDIPKDNLVTFITNLFDNPAVSVAEQHSAAAIDNRLLSIHKKVLTTLLSDSSTAKFMLKSIDGSELQGIAGADEAAGTSAMLLNPVSMVNKAIEVQESKQGVGISAANSKSHTVAQLYDHTIKANTLKTPLMLEANVDENGNYGISGELTREYKGTAYNISSLLEQAVNAFVDAAKNPWVFKLGVRKINAGVFLTGIRLGINPQVLKNLFTSPIVSEYVKWQAANNGIITNRAKTNLTEFLKSKGVSVNVSYVEGKPVTTMLVNGETIIPYTALNPSTLQDSGSTITSETLAILNEYENLKKLSGEIFKNEGPLFADTDDGNNSIDGDLYTESLTLSMNGAITNIAQSASGYFGPYIRNKQKGHNVIKKLSSINSSENGVKVRELIDGIVKEAKLPGKEVNKFTKRAVDLYKTFVVMTAKVGFPGINTERMSIVDVRKDLMTGNKSVVKSIERLQAEVKATANHPFASNFFLNNLVPFVRKNDIDSIRLSRQFVGVDYQKAVDGFGQLFRYTDPRTGFNVGHALMLMDYVQTAGLFNEMSISAYIPADRKAAFMKDVLAFNDNNATDADLFYTNLLTNVDFFNVLQGRDGKFGVDLNVEYTKSTRTRNKIDTFKTLTLDGSPKQYDSKQFSLIDKVNNKSYHSFGVDVNVRVIAKTKPDTSLSIGQSTKDFIAPTTAETGFILYNSTYDKSTTKKPKLTEDEWNSLPDSQKQLVLNEIEHC